MDTIMSMIASSRRFFILSWAHIYISSILDCRSTCSTPPDKSGFPFDTLAVAGVFGGDEAVSAMATVHVYENRRWLGWYNSPGSYQIAKRFRLLSKSRFSDRFFPGVHTLADPATLFESDVSKGPKFTATHSGTFIEETGHLAVLFVKECAALEGKVVEGRKSQAVGVTIAELKHVPPPQMYPGCINAYSPASASIPIIVSAVTCVACGVFDDWHSFSSILLGILANGVSCLVIGSARFVFTHPDTPKDCPPGDGILCSDTEIVLLKGAEGAVNSISRGRFSLGFSSEHRYRSIGWCSVLLNIQFIAQLLLVPQCSPFGRIMFASSLAVSWIYNSWLPSLDKKKIQRDILFNTVLEKPVLTKYSFGTRTTAVVFILLVLQPQEPTEILDELLPNETKVWRKWKETVVERLSNLNRKTVVEAEQLRNDQKLVFVDTDWVLDGFTQRDTSLLETLYGDAQAAYGAYIEYYTAPSPK